MGQYGRIVKATVSKVKNNFYSAFVEYETEVEAALALLVLRSTLSLWTTCCTRER